ncbi:hypothetical protein [Pseudoalteromonas ruthenica]|uniref:hypothetical protein n=1 Tax=Pseudoalteromonas ruthenica TaxID=151081 RepID=UPI00241CF061|nr:hypothetical protein [Pseudoalteromonas ruthenica]
MRRLSTFVAFLTVITVTFAKSQVSFQHVDSDHNHSISYLEAQQLDGLAPVFSDLDRNRDNTLSADEFARFRQQQLTLS